MYRSDAIHTTDIMHAFLLALQTRYIQVITCQTMQTKYILGNEDQT